MVGFVFLQREFLEWEWYQSPEVSRLYIHLLLKANYIDKPWQGIVITRGQLVTSVNSLSAELKLSTQQIRTALSKLEKGLYITKYSTNNYTLITFVNYDLHQSTEYNSNKRNNKPKTVQKQSNNIPSTTTQEINNNNNVKKETIEARRELFKKQVFECSSYSHKILTDFFDYWSELNIEKTKMRKENENFFELKKRLLKWANNEKNNKQMEKGKLLTNR